MTDIHVYLHIFLYIYRSICSCTHTPPGAGYNGLDYLHIRTYINISIYTTICIYIYDDLWLIYIYIYIYPNTYTISFLGRDTTTTVRSITDRIKYISTYLFVYSRMYSWTHTPAGAGGHGLPNVLWTKCNWVCGLYCWSIRTCKYLSIYM